MKNLILLGKFNPVLKEIYTGLKEEYYVQLCPDNDEIFQNMLKIEEPDLIVVSMMGMDTAHRQIFNTIYLGYSYIPVVCIGNNAEQSYFSDYLKLVQFRVLSRPTTNREILDCVAERLGRITEKEESEPEVFETKKMILLIDDNALQLRVIKTMIPDAYDVQMATSGAKALSIMGKKKPALIFLDYEMPGCDGRMTLEMIRNIEELSNIPVVFLTGVKDKEHIKAVLRLNPAGYLLKPADKDRILETIEQFVPINP